jgi:ABC-2 type transport system ATP-binding protein
MSVIEFDRVTKRYGEFTALDAITLSLPENTITGLLGRNGAGKSTLMQIATAQVFATSGTVRVLGEEPYDNPRVMDQVCLIGENQRYPDWFKVRHVLASGAILFPGWDRGLAEELVHDFGLRPGQLVKKLSRGQRSAVGVIVGLASRAPVTFFDEPYLGLDAVARQLFYDRLLADYADHPRTVVLSTHLIDEVSDLVEHVVVIDRGRILMDDDAETLRGSAVVVSGPRRAVDEFAAGSQVLHREDLGGFCRVTVRGAPPHAAAEGLTLEPVSLQQLVVRTTMSTAPQDGASTREKVAQS